tara:strand:- start:46 stop:927 length:882 start_codon:yes stop_codon:yes gene_type:complete
MPSPYNDVEITEDDKQSLFENPGIKEDQNPTEAPVEVKDDIESQAHETESPEGASEVSESDEFNLEDYEVEIDGEVFDGADILSWREDSSNKENWQAKNTQEAQRIAQWSKLSQKLSEDNEFRDYMKDYFYDNEDELNKLGLNKEFSPIEADTVESAPQEAMPEEDDKYSEVSNRLDEMELERHVDELELELDEIVDNNQSLFKDEESEVAFLEFAEESGMTDLNQAFKVWAYDTMQGELDHHRKLDGNRQRNQGKVVHNSRVGAVEEETPRKYKEMKDITMDDPGVRKYFDN